LLLLDEKSPNAVAEELRLAFAAGRNVDGETLLARALEAGLPWDVLTRAVADGVARAYRARVTWAPPTAVTSVA
jgi:hypothetical protein